MRKDARGFSIWETEHATIFAQPGVGDTRTQEVGKAFEIAYRVVSQDLGVAEIKSALYVYQSYDDLLQDLVTTWKYSEWFKTFRAIPRMNRDYVMWVPPLPRGDASFIGHEYSHRIIEQIAGINSQIHYKWFDEGIAEYAGLASLAQQSPEQAQARSTERIEIVINAQKNGRLYRLKELTTEEQFAKAIERDAMLAYSQSALAVDYLIHQRGMTKIKNVLSMIGAGSPFADAFQKTHGSTIDDFENDFLIYVTKLKNERTDTLSDVCFKVDGDASDWQKLQPLIKDAANPQIIRAADILLVHAAVCQGALYVMFTVDGRADAGEEVNYAFELDTTGDETPEFQPGFDRTRGWLWDLRGTGYADIKSNMVMLNDTQYQVAVAQVAEFMIPIKLLNTPTTLRIRPYNFVQGQMANRRTLWGVVPTLLGR